MFFRKTRLRLCKKALIFLVPIVSSYPSAWGEQNKFKTNALPSLRSRLEEVIGPVPQLEMRTRLSFQILENTKFFGLSRLKVKFNNGRGAKVPAYLFIPDNVQSVPAVLCLHQTNSFLGKTEAAGIFGNSNLAFALDLAQLGFITLAPDYPGFGEYEYRGTDGGMARAIWDNMIAISYLQSLPDINPNKIGVIGHSLGALNALFTASVNTNIKAAVLSAGFSKFGTVDDTRDLTLPRYLPQLTKYSNTELKIPFTIAELVSSIAPRRVFISAPIFDDAFDIKKVKETIAEAAPTFERYGPNILMTRFPETGHELPTQTKQEAYQFLKDTLL
jgi:pimeloyl-ACP methyl ester carboxylesterase